MIMPDFQKISCSRKKTDICFFDLFASSSTGMAAVGESVGAVSEKDNDNHYYDNFDVTTIKIDWSSSEFKSISCVQKNTDLR